MSDRKAKGKSSRGHKSDRHYNQDSYSRNARDATDYDTEARYRTEAAYLYASDPYAEPSYHNAPTGYAQSSYTGTSLNQDFDSMSIDPPYVATQNPSRVGSFAKAPPKDQPPGRPPGRPPAHPQDPFFGLKRPDGENYQVAPSNDYDGNPMTVSNRIPRQAHAVLPVISQSSAGQGYGSSPSYEHATEAVKAKDLADSCEQIEVSGKMVFQRRVKVWQDHSKSSKRTRSLADMLLRIDSGSDHNWVSQNIVEDLAADTSRYTKSDSFVDFSGNKFKADRKVTLTFRTDTISRTHEFLVCPVANPPFDILIGGDDCYKHGILGAPNFPGTGSKASLPTDEKALAYEAYEEAAAAMPQAYEESKQSSSLKGKEREKDRGRHKERTRDKPREERREKDKYRNDDASRSRREHRRK